MSDRPTHDGEDYPITHWYRVEGRLTVSTEPHEACGGVVLEYVASRTREVIHAFCETCGAITYTSDPFHPAHADNQ